MPLRTFIRRAKVGSKMAEKQLHTIIIQPNENSKVEGERPAHAINLDGPPQYQLVEARSILNRVKEMMPMSWTINPYRGCRHACVYCYARPTHTYYGLNAGADFHTRLFVKINAPQLLRKELARPSWKGESICLGSATDPYQPAERRFRLSHQILEVLYEAANPLDIITKSPLVVDDLDLLLELDRRTGRQGRVAVNMSITTLNETKARQIDPGAPAAHKRLEALARLTAAGLKTRLFIMPILPGISDRPDELEELVRTAAELGIKSVSIDAFRIARGSEEHFYRFLDKNYPELRPRYERIYARGRRTMAADRYREALRHKMAELRIKYNLAERAYKGEGVIEVEAKEQMQQAAFTDLIEEPARLIAALESAENRSPQPVNKTSQLPPNKMKPAPAFSAQQASFNLS
jgi:DNA repair photolyase